MIALLRDAWLAFLDCERACDICGCPTDVDPLCPGCVRVGINAGSEQACVAVGQKAGKLACK